MFELLSIIGDFGGGGAIVGVVIFLMYRQDRRSTERRLSKLLEKDQETREANTKAVTEMTTYLVRANGRVK